LKPRKASRGEYSEVGAYELIEEIIPPKCTRKVLVARRRGRLKTFWACPECFDFDNGGGIILDGFCTSCGYSPGAIWGEIADAEKRREAKQNKTPKDPLRLSWTAPQEEDPQRRSMIQIAIDSTREGLNHHDIAEQLNKFDLPKPVSAMNVAAHLSHARKAGKV
jgi:hypothetical protein